MATFMARRLLTMIPVALLVSFVTFMIIHLIPGDPARVLLGESATPETVAALHHQLGLDKPLLVQYFLWLGDALHGDLGQSLQLAQPVMQAILQRLPITLELGVISLIVSVALAIPLGVLAAARRTTAIDWWINVTSLIGTAIPNFVLGLILILFLAVIIRAFPPGGYVPFTQDPIENLHRLVLPVITLAAGAVAGNMRQIRASMIEVLNQDYIRTARAKGLSRGRVYFVHALRNALLPFLTIVGLQAGAILGGAVVIETIFLWPGVGLLAVQSILSKDYPVVQGIVLLSALSYMLVNLLVDVSYGVLDPRINLSSGS